MGELTKPPAVGIDDPKIAAPSVVHFVDPTPNEDDMSTVR
jgi:hypothetical protein